MTPRRRREVILALAITSACLVIVVVGFFVGLAAWYVYNMSQLH